MISLLEPRSRVKRKSVEILGNSKNQLLVHYTLSKSPMQALCCLCAGCGEGTVSAIDDPHIEVS